MLGKLDFVQFSQTVCDKLLLLYK